MRLGDDSLKLAKLHNNTMRIKYARIFIIYYVTVSVYVQLLGGQNRYGLM